MRTSTIAARAAERPGRRHSSIFVGVCRREEVRTSTSGVRASPPAHRVCSCTHAMIGSGCVRVHVLLQHPTSGMRRRHAVHSRPEAAAVAISTFLRTNAPGRPGGNTRLCSCLRAVECARAGKGGSPGANLPSQSRSRLPPLPCRLSPRWVSRARASPHSTPHSERGLRCQRKECEGRSICHILAHCSEALSPMRAARSQRHSRSTTHSRDVAAHTSRRILANSPRRKRSERLLLGLLDDPSA